MFNVLASIVLTIIAVLLTVSSTMEYRLKRPLGRFYTFVLFSQPVSFCCLAVTFILRFLIVVAPTLTGVLLVISVFCELFFLGLQLFAGSIYEWYLRKTFDRKPHINKSRRELRLLREEYVAQHSIGAPGNFEWLPNVKAGTGQAKHSIPVESPNVMPETLQPKEYLEPVVRVLSTVPEEDSPDATIIMKPVFKVTDQPKPRRVTRRELREQGILTYKEPINKVS